MKNINIAGFFARIKATLLARTVVVVAAICLSTATAWALNGGADAANAFVISSNQGAVTLNSGYYRLEGTFTNIGRLTVSGDVHLILQDLCDVTITGGIGVGPGNSLTIDGNTGKLTANGGYRQAGIGGVWGTNSGTIIINGGDVSASGNEGGAGIGGGNGGSGLANTTINGGTVTVTGGGARAGISGNTYYYGNKIAINGGSVKGSIDMQPTNDDGASVYLTILTVGSGTTVDDAAIAAAAISTTPYGVNGVKTDANGLLYFWLPANSGTSVDVATGGNLYTNTTVAVTDNSSNGVLAANGTATLYSATYNANGAIGDVPTTAIQYLAGTQVRVLGNTGDLAKTDYYFGGWTVDNGIGAKQSGETFTMPAAATTLTAIWKKATVTDAQSGTLTYGTPGGATYAVTTEGIADGNYTVTLGGSVPTGVTATVSIMSGSGTLTLNTTTATPAGTTTNLTATIDGAVSGAFTLAVNNATLTITPNANQSKVYGDNDPAAYTYSASGWKNGESETSGLFTGALTRATGDDVGYYAITNNNLSAGGNYTIDVATGVNFEITRATLTITPDANQSKYYGDNDPAYTYTPSGWKYADAAASATLLSGALTRATGENVNTYAITNNGLSAGSNYTIDVATGVNFEIKPADIATATVNINGVYTYNGTAQTPAAADVVVNFTTALFGSAALSDGTDYDLSATDNTNAGTDAATLTVTGKGNYTGTVPKTFTINKKQLTDAMFTGISETYTYNGTKHTPASSVLIVTDGGALASTDWELTGLSYGENINAGTDAGSVTIYATSGGNYSGSAVKTFTITQKPLTNAMFTAIGGIYEYTGTQHTPLIGDLTVADGGALVAGDWELTGLSYGANINAGTNVGSVTVFATATGNYSGSATQNFTITQKPLTNAMFTGISGTYIYNGTKHTPLIGTLTVADGGALVAGDWELTGSSYGTNIDAGTNVGSVTIYATSGGNYSGSATRTFTIDKKPLTNAMFTAIGGTYEYTGTQHTPLIGDLTVADGGALVAGDWELTGSSYGTNKDAGTDAGSVTIYAKSDGNYSGSATKTFTITPATVNVAWGNTSLIYTGSSQMPTATATGVQGENIPLSVSGAQTAPGSYTANAVMTTSNPNYRLANTPTPFTISMAVLTGAIRLDAGNYDFAYMPVHGTLMFVFSSSMNTTWGIGTVTLNGNTVLTGGVWISETTLILPYGYLDYSQTCTLNLTGFIDRTGYYRYADTTFTFTVQPEPPTPAITRRIAIPLIPGVTTVPSAGWHYIQSGSDFTFTVTPPAGMEPTVYTNRIVNGKQETLKGTPNGDGSYTFKILEVRQDMEISVTFAVGNEEVNASKVWSNGNRLYIRTEKVSTLYIYTTGGRLYKRQTVPEGNTTIMLPTGVYFIVIDGKQVKVRLYEP